MPTASIITAVMACVVCIYYSYNHHHIIMPTHQRHNRNIINMCNPYHACNVCIRLYYGDQG